MSNHLTPLGKHAAEDIARLVMEPLIGGHEDIVAVAEALALVAWKRGFVLTIETKAEAPLAMGHYGLGVHVRPRRDVQAAAQKNLEDNDARVGRRFNSYGRGGR